ncbi:NACHT domain-containing protein [Pseudomonas sp. NPDC089534]|uniref:NACHT domain-containing protein n=1 Tax=Pseudomonas sp. NPDC089534 TaxID=3364468 RepID=UPI00380B87D4
MSSELDINKIVPELVKQFGAPIFSGAKALSKSVVDKLKVNLDVCFTKYILNHYDRYSKTKTLLYRGEPVPLRDFYVRTDLLSGAKEVLSESKVLDLIEVKQRIIINGSAGSGKSTFCKSIFMDLIERPRGVFPVFIELRHLNSIPETSVLVYLCSMLADFESGFSLEQLEGSMKLGKVLLIFDGFDELALDKRDKFEAELLNISNKYINVMILVSSRPDGRFSSWEAFYQYDMRPLDLKKAKSLVGKLNYDVEIKKKFLQELELSLFERHRSFAENPLLLTMMLLTYEQFAEIPNKIHLFYEQAFQTLFNKHDSLKSLFKRKSFTGLPIDDFKKVLSAFCALSYAEKKYAFDNANAVSYVSKAVKLSGVSTSEKDFLNDLLDNICIMQRDGLNIAFTHRSFQEYFTALFLVDFSGSRKFELIQKIAFSNQRDDVIPMVFDINKGMLEEAWLIPALTSLFEQYDPAPKSDLGRVKLLAALYNGVCSFDNEGSKDVAFLGNAELNINEALVDVVLRLYDIQPRYSTKKVEKDQALARRLDEFDGELGLDDIDSFDPELLKLIAESGLADFCVREFSAVNGEFKKMKKRRSAKQDDVSSLFFD